VNIVGDEQADRRVHGGPDKAVYAYAVEDTRWWERALSKVLGPGAFGENLTLAGVNVTEAIIGERWEIGSALFEVAQPRVPCWKLGARMGDPDFPRIFAEAGRPGAYLRIVREGEIGAGDNVSILYRPAHGVTIGKVAHIYHNDDSEAHFLLSIKELAEQWHAWAKRKLIHADKER
jgi:MOSC domain-containing protein YiiM